MLLPLLVLAGGSMAQTTNTPSYLNVVTTAMTGVAASQTAQLNVLNTSVVPLGALAIACPVELDFYDSQGRVVKTATVTNVSPGNSTSLTLKLSEFPTASPVSLHTLVRGVVKTNLVSTTPPPTAAGAVILPGPSGGGCNVLTSLEVFDTTSGVTQSFTTDTRSLQPFIVALFNPAH